MSKELLAAIQTGRTWLDRFTRRDYPEAFKEYTARFGPAYLEAVRAAGGRRPSRPWRTKFWMGWRRAGSASASGTVLPSWSTKSR